MSHTVTWDPGSWARLFDNEHFHPGSPDGTSPAEHQRRFGAAVAYNAFGIGNPSAPAHVPAPPPQPPAPSASLALPLLVLALAAVALVVVL